jgi:hypothetical protein
MTTRKKRRVKTKPPADFFREKVKRLDSTSEVRMLRLELCLAADALAAYYERHELRRTSVGNAIRHRLTPTSLWFMTGLAGAAVIAATAGRQLNADGEVHTVPRAARGCRRA